MKHCPICDARYDEEIIRFCTKDGTPLVEDEQPNFAVLPSESLETPDDDLGEETIIRRKPLGADPAADIFASPAEPERIIIPTSFPPEQQVRPRTSQAYFPPPPPPNTGKTVTLTILGTMGVLGLGAVLFFFLRGNEPSNVNVNTNPINQNLNLNTNFGFDSNFNFNATANFNTNYNVSTNLNTNVRTSSPTPTPRPAPSTTPTPNPSTSPTPSANATPRVNATPRTNVNARPSPSQTPRTGPRPPALNINRPAGNGND